MHISDSDIKEQKLIMKNVRERFSAVQAKKPLVYIDTYGCQQNESDSEKIRGMLLEMGYEIAADEYAADVIVINTCAIRENAENRVFGNVGDLIHTKKAKPNQLIAVCGCMMAISINIDRVKNMYKHVNIIFEPAAIWRFPELLHAALCDMYPSIEEKEEKVKLQTDKKQKPKRIYEITGINRSQTCIAEGLPIHRDKNIKAWLPIMHGCDNFCAYCIVPYVRGREVSREPDAILSEAREIIKAGYKDITLLGQNVNSYNPVEIGETYNFPRLLRNISNMDGEFCCVL